MSHMSNVMGLSLGGPWILNRSGWFSVCFAYSSSGTEESQDAGEEEEKEEEDAEPMEVDKSGAKESDQSD